MSEEDLEKREGGENENEEKDKQEEEEEIEGMVTMEEEEEGQFTKERRDSVGGLDLDLKWCVDNVLEKARAGADFCISQFCYNPNLLITLMNQNLPIPIIPGFLPILVS